VGSARQRTSNRARKRSSARTNAGPNARQKTRLPTAWARLNPNDVPLKAMNCPTVCSPLNVTHVEKSRIAP
jgi:hypothetical protein